MRCSVRSVGSSPSTLFCYLYKILSKRIPLGDIKQIHLNPELAHIILHAIREG